MRYIKLTLFVKYKPNLIEVLFLVPLILDLSKHHICITKVQNMGLTHEQGEIRWRSRYEEEKGKESWRRISRGANIHELQYCSWQRTGIQLVYTV
jgi:hypothetical protein